MFRNKIIIHFEKSAQLKKLKNPRRPTIDSIQFEGTNFVAHKKNLLLNFLKTGSLLFISNSSLSSEVFLLTINNSVYVRYACVCVCGGRGRWKYFAFPSITDLLNLQ